MDSVGTLLESVRVLHKRGYEGLRISPYIYGTGHWRCSLSVIGKPMSPDDFTYSQAQNWDYFNKNAQQKAGEKINPEELADMMIEKLPELLEQSKFKCTAYTVWYDVLLNYCGEAGIFYLASEYYTEDGKITDAKTAGYVKVENKQSGSLKFPLSPVF